MEDFRYDVWLFSEWELEVLQYFGFMANPAIFQYERLLAELLHDYHKLLDDYESVRAGYISMQEEIRNLRYGRLPS
jgi:hypothetical protein